MSMLVSGTIGIDTIITPTGRADDVLGGTAVYASYAASFYTDVRLVGVVGDDFPPAFRDLLASRDISLIGLETRSGSKTFRWTGQYQPNLNDRDTVDVQLGVVEEEGPALPPAYADSEVVFLANNHPRRQHDLRDEVDNARFVVSDTMDIWINTKRDELLETLKVVDGLILNDSEAELLTGEVNALRAADRILHLGPRFVVIKKGAHGAIMAGSGHTTVIPAYPVRQVIDPTGAGDTFAGGMLGYLSTQTTYDEATMRRSLVHGTVLASFTIEDFSVGRLRNLAREQIDERVDQFIRMLRIE